VIQGVHQLPETHNAPQIVGVRYLRVATLVLAGAVGTGGASGLSGCASSNSARTGENSVDDGMAQRIAKRYSADARLCPFAISVAVHKGTAHLQGKVASEADRRRAGQIAREAGAAAIEDRLVIDPSAGERGMC
jgi:osmotically-inducible protein OsmY